MSVANLTKEFLKDERKGPSAGLEIVIKEVRRLCEKVAPLQKHKAFLEYFRRGHRKPGEPITDFIQRRSDAYDKLVDLTGGKTQVSEDLRTFFLLDMCGISEEKHKDFLGQASNEYDWDAIVSVLQIQLDTVDTKKTMPHNNRRFGRWNSAYPVEGDDEDYDEEDGEEANLGEEEDDEEDEAFAADVQEFEDAMWVIDPN